ncbi:MAG: hypothetical protein ACP5HK_01360 [Acidilobus sp.]
MTLLIRLSRRMTARGLDVESVAAGLKSLVAGFIVKPALLARLGEQGLLPLRSEGTDKMLIADLRLEDSVSEVSEVASLSPFVNLVTVTWRLAVSEDWPAVGKLLSSSGLRPVLAITKYDLGSLGKGAASVVEKAIKSSGITYVLLPSEGREVMGLLLKAILPAQFIIEDLDLGRGLCLGAKYEVIGQEVLDAEDPVGSVRMAIYRQRRTAEECLGGVRG